MITEGSSDSEERLGRTRAREEEGEEEEEQKRGREKKRGIALRSASRCRVHRFRLPSTTLDTSSVHTDVYTRVYAPNIAKRSVKGHADVRACQIIICNCRAG